jgi:hypothetical protein
MNGGIINSNTRLHLVGYFYGFIFTDLLKICKEMKALLQPDKNNGYFA